MVERRSPKPQVAGSIPAAPANVFNGLTMLAYFTFYSGFPAFYNFVPDSFLHP
jgi:hypothetical protein